MGKGRVGSPWLLRTLVGHLPFDLFDVRISFKGHQQCHEIRTVQGRFTGESACGALITWLVSFSGLLNPEYLTSLEIDTYGRWRRPRFSLPALRGSLLSSAHRGWWEAGVLFNWIRQEAVI